MVTKNTYFCFVCFFFLRKCIAFKMYEKFPFVFGSWKCSRNSKMNPFWDWGCSSFPKSTYMSHLDPMGFSVLDCWVWCWTWLDPLQAPCLKIYDALSQSLSQKSVFPGSGHTHMIYSHSFLSSLIHVFTFMLFIQSLSWQISVDFLLCQPLSYVLCDIQLAF